jgi:hypothetical protein
MQAGAFRRVWDCFQEGQGEFVGLSKYMQGDYWAVEDEINNYFSITRVKVVEVEVEGVLWPITVLSSNWPDRCSTTNCCSVAFVYQIIITFVGIATALVWCWNECTLASRWWDDWNRTTSNCFNAFINLALITYKSTATT